jgi:haloalkane dehalogenase
MDILRTPDERFAGLAHFAFEPHYLEINGLRMHHLDEGPRDAPVMLLLHGEPSWSYLYRHWVPALVEAGYRAVAVDSVGFGRSDKVTDPSWYSLDRHVEQLIGVIEALDLRDITITVQDWAGPVGLCAVAEVDDRFSRLVILNTWLHHDEYVYTDAIRMWHEMAKRPELPFGLVVSNNSASCSADPVDVLQRGYQAPFTTPASMAGAVAWPAMLPFADPERGGADRQAAALTKLRRWDRPAHVLFGDGDPVFSAESGQQFAAMIPGATFGIVSGGTHFVQEVGRPLAERVLGLIGV